ncbi:unnamed protein product [Alopecurus aequalis]
MTMRPCLEPTAAAPPRALALLGTRSQHAQLRLPHVPREPIRWPPRRRARPQLGIVLHPRSRVGERLVSLPELDEELCGLGTARRRADVGVVLQRQAPVRALDIFLAHVRRVLQRQHLVVIRRPASPGRRRRLDRAAAVAAPPDKAGAVASNLGRASQRGGTGAGGVHG